MVRPMVQLYNFIKEKRGEERRGEGEGGEGDGGEEGEGTTGGERRTEETRALNKVTLKGLLTHQRTNFI